MSVTPENVRHVAGLARLGIPEATLATYVQQLNGILEHVDVLQRVDTSGLAAATRGAVATEHGMPLREDVVAPVPLTRERADFAPQMAGGFFLVPRLATHEDAGDES
jgi:aspartyl-tRNA(Asn)/glutamyl-tRNA(Gln) amidotransferase subunit C